MSHLLTVLGYNFISLKSSRRKEQIGKKIKKLRFIKLKWGWVWFKLQFEFQEWLLFIRWENAKLVKYEKEGICSEASSVLEKVSSTNNSRS